MPQVVAGAIKSVSLPRQINSEYEVTAMATIESRTTQKGKDTFRVRVRLKSARVATASFRRRTDAVKWAQSTEAAIREGRYFRTSASKRYLLSDAIDRYEREILPQKPRGAKLQKRQLAWWHTQLGDLFLADVTASAIAQARTKILSDRGARDRRRGPATANRYMAVLSHLLAVAVREWEWLEINPARRLKLLKEPRGPMLAPSHPAGVQPVKSNKSITVINRTEGVAQITAARHAGLRDRHSLPPTCGGGDQWFAMARTVLCACTADYCRNKL